MRKHEASEARGTRATGGLCESACRQRRRGRPAAGQRRGRESPGCDGGARRAGRPARAARRGETEWRPLRTSRPMAGRRTEEVRERKDRRARMAGRQAAQRRAKRPRGSQEKTAVAATAERLIAEGSTSGRKAARKVNLELRWSGEQRGGELGRARRSRSPESASSTGLEEQRSCGRSRKATEWKRRRRRRPRAEFGRRMRAAIRHARAWLHARRQREAGVT